MLAERTRIRSGTIPPAHRRRRNGPIDTILVSAVVALVSLGLVMIFSASSATAYAEHHDAAYFLKRQIVWLAIGIVLAVLAYRIDYRKLRALAPAFLGLALVSLLLVLVPHVGIVSNGARRWLGVGAATFQPSEPAKLALIVFVAAAATARGKRIRHFVDGFVPICAVAAFIAVLILIEPDMGTASLLVFTAAAMLFAAGAKPVHMLGAACAVGPLAALSVLMSKYKRDRILVFMDPFKDPQNTGFHIVQSLYALGSGGLFGVGLGFSRQKFFYLPEQHTDFIAAIIGEELGMFGLLVVIALFLTFAYRAIRIALATRDRFGFMLVIGCTSMIVIQAFINIGVVTSSWPVTGVPLPFISFGGTSLVVSLVAVALVLNVGRDRIVHA